MAGALWSPERPPNGCFRYKVPLHLSIFTRTQTKPPPDMQLFVKHRMPAPPRVPEHRADVLWFQRKSAGMEQAIKGAVCPRLVGRAGSGLGVRHTNNGNMQCCSINTT
jgi:hypothetical protein